MILLKHKGPTGPMSSLLKRFFVILGLVTLSVHGIGGSAMAASNASTQEPETRNTLTAKTEFTSVQQDPSSQSPSNPAASAPDVSGSNSEAQRTTVTLLQGVKNSIQLGIEVNGQFAYPFVFTADPQKTGDIEISPSGLITGSPSESADQNVAITVKDFNGKPMASYSILLHVSNAQTVMLGPSAAAIHRVADGAGAKASQNQPQPIVAPVYAGGDTVKGSFPVPKPKKDPTASVDATAKNQGNAQAAAAGASADKAATASTAGELPPTVDITCDSHPPHSVTSICNSGHPPNVATVAVDGATGAFSYQFNAPLAAGDTVTVSSSSGPSQIVPVQSPPRFLGEELRAIVGYQQAGASSSDFEQNWFSDFYISRGLHFHYHARDEKEPERVRLRWWGNVRVASFPQSGNQSVADIATGLSTQLGAVKLNQLAEGAEFLSGLEFQGWRSPALRGFSENSRQVFTLGIIAGAGATGFFTSPSHSVQVFQVPAAGSPQFSVFQKSYPGVTTANVGFISPDLERFPKQWLAGVRLTTHYVDPTGMPLVSAPAMLAVSLGQNQVLTGGGFKNVVGRVEAFYPLPLGNRGQTVAGAFSSLYLFASAQMRVHGGSSQPALVLQPADATVHAYDPSVTLVTSQSTRDFYRIGFGIDLVSFVASLTGGQAKANTTAAASKTPPPAKTPAP